MTKPTTFARAAVVAVALLLTACTPNVVASDLAAAEQTSAAPAPAPPDVPAEDVSSAAEPAPAGAFALAAVDQLAVKGRAPKTGYDRDQFGQAWADVNRNGCDTRNDILARDLTDLTFKPGTNNCVVLSGNLADPFTGTTIAFTRGQDTSTAVQIDHVVALSDAWQKGAQQWDAGTRERFANDPLNLMAVDGPLNGQKGDGDTATWLPPNTSFRCQYVARQVAVKVGYGLWVTQAEKDAMVRVLSGCPDEPLPTGDAPTPVQPPVAQPAPPVAVPAQPVEEPAPAEVAPPAAEQGQPFANCAAARAAGAAPVRVGDPGYGTHLDRDGDGVGCE